MKSQDGSYLSLKASEEAKVRRSSHVSCASPSSILGSAFGCKLGCSERCVWPYCHICLLHHLRHSLLQHPDKSQASYHPLTMQPGPGDSWTCSKAFKPQSTHQQLSNMSSIQVLAVQKLERLRGSLHFLDAEAPAEARHTFFVDSREEAAELDPAEHLGTSQVCWSACLA